MIACAKCGAIIDPSQKTCLKCGTVSPNALPGTVHLRGAANVLRLRRGRAYEARSSLPEWTVILQIRGLSERLQFVDGAEVILGQPDVLRERETCVDLSRYGAHQRGVSRRHALLRFANRQVTLTDLNSLNGTSINRIKLEPNRSYPLHNGDEIMVGGLSIRIVFNLSEGPSQDGAASSPTQNGR
jgi:hypothetical protein